ncbi:cell adhesion molecule CEACAM1-like [Pempheris klunzingeri]|uniref:cell adhesion molecule CEACAM1-like n=1 Tax=Pempheris klunzingeri TaxID=3127111 RepID=UPI00397F1FC1
MATVVGLLVMLLGISHGVKPYCDGRQDGAQCYGALGGTVVLQLMDGAAENSTYIWSIRTQRIFTWTGKGVFGNVIGNRSSFTPSNGTFIINNLNRLDGGNHTLQIFDSNGAKSEQRSLQLTIQVVETYCDGRQDGAQCYGALGGTVVLQLMDGAAENSIYIWSIRTQRIFTWTGKGVFGNVIGNRSSFTPSNGAIIINNLNRLDGGNYTLQIFDSNGAKSEQRSLQLTIQAPVSSVWLVSKCLSQGEMRVSCSSEGGDSPQYSWTLGGRKLNGAELLSGNNESKNITLKQNVSGTLVCSVNNHVSRVFAEKMISTCGFIFIECISNGTYISQWVLKANNTLCIEPVTTEDHFLLIYGLQVAVAIILLSWAGAYIAWKKKTERSHVPWQTRY